MRSLVALCLFTGFTAQAAHYTTYACDTCDYQKAARLASWNAPNQECNWTNRPGTDPTPDDVECYAPAKTLVVANPDTQQAFKFRVQKQCYGTYCDDTGTITNLSLTTDDYEIMNAFFELHQTIFNAVLDIQSNINVQVQTQSYAQSSNENCEGSLLNYLTSSAYRNDTNQRMASIIIASAEGKSGAKYLKNTSPSSSQHNLTISKSPSYSATFNFDNMQSPLRHNISSGDPAKNMLVFTVDYVGNATTRDMSEIYFRFNLERHNSIVHGENLQILTSPGTTHNFAHPSRVQEISPCIIDFISEGAHIGHWEQSQTPIAMPDQDGFLQQLCPTTTQATVCSSTKEGQSCTTTHYHFLTACH